MRSSYHNYKYSMQNKVSKNLVPVMTILAHCCFLTVDRFRVVVLVFYFIVSGEISVYLMKIKVVSITSEMISYHFTCD